MSETTITTYGTDGSSNASGRLPRGAMLTYIDASFGSTTPKWFLIGKDVQDMSVELNPEVEQFRNILDETSAVDSGYSPSVSVDTYYADPNDGEFYEKLKNIAMNRLIGDDCKTKILEVIIDKKGSNAFTAWREECIVKPQSYGGASGGVRIPYQITFCGNRTEGTAAIEPGDKHQVTFLAADM